MTLLKGGGVILFLLQIITDDPAMISRKHFHPPISLQDCRNVWPEIEARCSYKIVLIKKQRGFED